MSIYRYITKSKHLCDATIKNKNCQVQNEAKLQDLVKNSKATTSTTEHFCKTSSTFEVYNVKHQAIPRDFLQKWKFKAEKQIQKLKAENRSFSARRSSNLVVENFFCEASCKSDMSVISQLQFDLQMSAALSQKVLRCIAPATKE